MDSQNTSEENLIDELTALREQKAELQAEIDRLRNSSQRFKIRNEVLELKVAERTAQLEAQVEQVTAVNMIMQMDDIEKTAGHRFSYRYVVDVIMRFLERAHE